MKKLLLITVLMLFAGNSYAVFSQHVRITPQTEKDYKIDVNVFPPHGKDDRYKIVLPAFDSTWLIVCQERLAPEEQDFRDVIWFKKEEGKKIEETRQLFPPAKQENKEAKQVEVYVKRDVMKRSYIYMDFSAPVFDGGYYYTIDLSAYLHKTANKKEKE